jgi:hypothetical protein
VAAEPNPEEIDLDIDALSGEDDAAASPSADDAIQDSQPVDESPPDDLFTEQPIHNLSYMDEPAGNGSNEQQPDTSSGVPAITAVQKQTPS